MPNVKLDKLKSSAAALRFMCDIKQEESHKKGENFVVSHVILLSYVFVAVYCSSVFIHVLKSEEQSQ